MRPPGGVVIELSVRGRSRRCRRRAGRTWAPPAAPSSGGASVWAPPGGVIVERRARSARSRRISSRARSSGGVILSGASVSERSRRISSRTCTELRRDVSTPGGMRRPPLNMTRRGSEPQVPPFAQHDTDGARAGSRLDVSTPGGMRRPPLNMTRRRAGQRVLPFAQHDTGGSGRCALPLLDMVRPVRTRCGLFRTTRARSDACSTHMRFTKALLCGLNNALILTGGLHGHG